MKKLTKQDIESFANEVLAYLEKYSLDYDVYIYYNNKRMHHEYDWMNLDQPPQIIIEEDMNPCDYFQYVNRNHIISMSFEGPLYDSINNSGYRLQGLQKIFAKYGVYWELGNSWNLSAYPIDDDMEIEFTPYGEPKKKFYLNPWDDTNNPIELQDIMDKWYLLSKQEGEGGSCVLGAGFDFTWDGTDYFMPACSPWQGSLSWEAHVDSVNKMLADIGATNIIYNWGNMD